MAKELNTNRILWGEVQYDESLVAYTPPIHIANLILKWKPELPDAELPAQVTLDYDVYNLEGESHNEIPVLIEWSTGADS